MTEIDGTEEFNSTQGFTAQKINKLVVWTGTALPVGAANKVPQYGKFLLLDSLSSPSTATWYIQTSATLSSPNFVEIPPSGSGALPYLKLSTTIGDYSSPASATVSSGGTLITPEGALKLGNGAGGAGFAGAPSEERGFRLNGLSGTEVKTCKVLLKKVGSPTGNMQLELMNSIIAARPSGAPIANGTSNTLDVSTLTTSYQLITFTWTTPPTVGTSHWIVLHFTGGDASNYVEIGGLSTSTDNPCLAVNASHSGDYFNSPASDDIYFEAYNSSSALVDSKGSPLSGAASLHDDNTGTAWTSSSEANPYAYVDLSSAREIVAIALNINKTTTTITSLKIRASTDTTFTDAENVAYVNISDFTDDTWRFLAINFLTENKRYVQFYANETGVLSINEIKVRYGVSDAAKILGHRHQTRNVSSASSFLDSNA